MQYTSVHIIYNPNSTGDSEALAKDLQTRLKKSAAALQVERLETRYAGHAEELAREIAQKQSKPLIISSSGDGGYNEVINGVMKSRNKNVWCAVLPAGNANDHSSAVQKQPLAQKIIKGNSHRLDLLQITVICGKEKTVRYAHSYIGLGLTPAVAAELNKSSLSALKEALIVVKTFFKHRPFKIVAGGKILKLDSLVFGNINRMAKVLTLAERNRPDDGKFEIVMFPAGRKWNLIKKLMKATVSSLDNVRRAESYEFKVIKKMPMQLDGEVVALKPGSRVKVVCKAKLLKTVA